MNTCDSILAAFKHCQRDLGKAVQLLSSVLLPEVPPHAAVAEGRSSPSREALQHFLSSGCEQGVLLHRGGCTLGGAGTEGRMPRRAGLCCMGGRRQLACTDIPTCSGFLSASPSH